MKQKDNIVTYTIPKMKKSKDEKISIDVDFTGKVTKWTVDFNYLLLEDMMKLNSHLMILSMGDDSYVSEKGFIGRWKEDIHSYFKKKASKYLDQAILKTHKLGIYRRYIIRKFTNFEVKKYDNS